MADGDAAVDRLSVNRRTTGAQVGVEPVFDLPLDCDGEVDFDSAIDSAGFKMRRVVLRHAQVDATIGGLGVQALTLPTRAGERNVESAVDGFTANIAGKPVKTHPAIGGLEVQIAIESRQVDAAIHGVKVSSKMTRHMQVVVDAVSRAIEEMRGRTVIANIAVIRVDNDLAQQIVSLGFRSRPRGHPRFEGHVGAILAGDVDAAIRGANPEVS